MASQTTKPVETVAYLDRRAVEASSASHAIHPAIKLRPLVTSSEVCNPSVGRTRKATAREPAIPPSVLSAVIQPTPVPAFSGPRTTIRMASGKAAPERIAGPRSSAPTIDACVATFRVSSQRSQSSTGSMRTVSVRRPAATCIQPKTRARAWSRSKARAASRLPRTMPKRAATSVSVYV